MKNITRFVMFAFLLTSAPLAWAVKPVYYKDKQEYAKQQRLMERNEAKSVKKQARNSVADAEKMQAAAGQAAGAPNLPGSKGPNNMTAQGKKGSAVKKAKASGDSKTILKAGSVKKDLVLKKTFNN